MALTLTGKIVRLHESLHAAGLPHAFGGALALAFCVQEPRATKDIDLNVFVREHHAIAVLDALPEGVQIPHETTALLHRDGQARLWWEGTPVDVFLSNHAFHDRAAANHRKVSFAGVDVFPVLACADLAVFKAVYARPKDAVDVATMVSVGSIDLDLLQSTIADLLGRDGRQDFLDLVSRMANDLA